MPKEELISPKVKDILNLLGKGVFLTSLFMFPGAGFGIAAIYNAFDKASKKEEYKNWKKYNPNRLRYCLQRLHRQKIIEIREENSLSIIRLTEKGKRKIIKYKLSEMQIKKQQVWDGKWRIIIYDISRFKRIQQDAFRRMLVNLHMLSLQKSVYLTPYPCKKEIKFLREYFDVGEEVLYLRADNIENEKAYKDYFGIK